MIVVSKQKYRLYRKTAMYGRSDSVFIQKNYNRLVQKVFWIFIIQICSHAAQVLDFCSLGVMAGKFWKSSPVGFYKIWHFICVLCAVSKQICWWLVNNHFCFCWFSVICRYVFIPHLCVCLVKLSSFQSVCLAICLSVHLQPPQQCWHLSVLPYLP